MAIDGHPAKSQVQRKRLKEFVCSLVPLSFEMRSVAQLFVEYSLLFVAFARRSHRFWLLWPAQVLPLGRLLAATPNNITRKGSPAQPQKKLLVITIPMYWQNETSQAIDVDRNLRSPFFRKALPATLENIGNLSRRGFHFAFVIC
jgi:hypothetical protein